MHQRKCILYIAMSIDGFIADESGGVKWLEENGKGEGDNGYSQFLAQVDTIIMGKTSYDQVLTFGEFPYPHHKCYVYSHHEQGSTQYVEFTQQSEIELLDSIRAHPGKDIWLLGGTKIVDSFLKQNLIDEFIITIIPVILGRGIPLFLPGHPNIPLQFHQIIKFGDFAQIRYTRIL